MSDEFLFEKLEVYQKALDFTHKIYMITKTWPKEYLFDLISQLRRASLSISLNIAEGNGRTKKDFSRFLDISRGSCFECMSVIDLAWKEQLLDDIMRGELRKELVILSKMLHGLKRSLQR